MGGGRWKIHEGSLKRGADDRLADELDALSRKIHDHPELAYQEEKACAWLTEFLAAKGFKVERGVAGIDTAFRATIETGVGPTIAILCEYDALPGIGHACGHNVIATSGAGAGAALAAAKELLPRGRIQVIGTPAEEGGGGKVKLIKGGVFKDVDCAMMIHGFDRTLLHQDLLGIVRVHFEFTGKATHASVDPWEGVNALDACIQTFNAVSMLRQQMRPECRIHGIITHGGSAANIIPEYAAATFYVRAPRLDTMWDLYRESRRLRRGRGESGRHRAHGHPARGGLRATQAQPDAARPVRREHEERGPRRGRAPARSTRLLDIGNVSQVIPAIQPMIAIAPAGTAIHSRAFAEAAVMPLARAGLVAAAKAMALHRVRSPRRPAPVWRRPRRSLRDAELSRARRIGPRRVGVWQTLDKSPGRAENPTTLRTLPTREGPYEATGAHRRGPGGSSASRRLRPGARAEPGRHAGSTSSRRARWAASPRRRFRSAARATSTGHRCPST